MDTLGLTAIEGDFVWTAASVEIILEATVEDDGGRSIGPVSEIGEDGAGVTLHKLSQTVAIGIDGPDVPVPVSIAFEDKPGSIGIPRRP